MATCCAATARRGTSREHAVASIGVLGGAFNPPHIGHLVLAGEAVSQLGLDRVLLMPTGRAPHREIDPEPGTEVRLRLATAACEPDEPIETSDLELRSEGPSFTYRTLELLSETGPEDELTFLMGADVAASLASWQSPDRVAELARIGVAARPGTDTSEAERTLDELGARWELVRMPQIGISSTEIRERIVRGAPVRHLVPSKTLEMIEREGLYR